MSLHNEINVLKVADHPNMVKLYEVFEDEKGLHMAMEFLAGGELFDRIQKRGHFPEREAADIMFKLLHAINHMHSMNICHRDLKAENIMFDT